MPGLAAFADRHGDDAGFSPEIDRSQPGDLAVSHAGKHPGHDDRAQVGVADVHQPDDLVIGEVADAGRVHLAERLHGLPRRLGLNPPFVVCEVQRRLQHAQDSVRGRPARPDGIVVGRIDHPPFLPARRASPRA
jgi:hypothetical protein